MKERVSTVHRRADGALVVALSFLILGVAPLVGGSMFAETLEQVFSPAPVAATVPEESVELATARLAAESQCLAEAMYHEARGEGVDGQKAVAEVVLQRTRSRQYGSTVCAVVFEGIEPGRLDCQFSFACDGSRNRPKEEGVWQQTKLLAERIMTGQVKLADRTQQAIAYHSIEVTPFWSARMRKTVQIGNHVFYRFAPRDRSERRDAQSPPQNVRSKVQSISAEGVPASTPSLPDL